MSASESRLCIPFLTGYCKIPLETLRAHADLKKNKVFTQRDPGFAGDDYRYDPPVGWCWIPITPARSISSGRWDYSYHGTPPASVGSILKNQLVLPGNRTREGLTIKIQPGHIPNQKFIFTSPSIHCASHYVYAWPVEWIYEGKTYYVRTVFQVRQKHDAYSMRRNTLVESCWDPSVSFDDHFRNEEMEWCTSDQQSVMLTGLLIHFSGVPVKTLVKQREDERRRRAIHYWGCFNPLLGILSD